MGREELAVRVARLERQNRKLRRLSIAAVLLVAGCVAMGQATSEGIPELVKVRSLQVVDAEGESRILLGVEEDGPAGIVVTDRTGEPRAMIGVGEDGSPVVRLSDPSGRLRATVLVDLEGDPSVQLLDAGGTVRLKLATVDGQPGLAMMDSRGVERAVLASMTGGEVGLALNGEGGVLRAALGTVELVKLLTEAEGLPSAAYLLICDREGRVVHQIP